MPLSSWLCRQHASPNPLIFVPVVHILVAGSGGHLSELCWAAGKCSNVSLRGCRLEKCPFHCSACPALYLMSRSLSSVHGHQKAWTQEKKALCFRLKMLKLASPGCSQDIWLRGAPYRVQWKVALSVWGWPLRLVTPASAQEIWESVQQREHLPGCIWKETWGHLNLCLIS